MQRLTRALGAAALTLGFGASMVATASADTVLADNGFRPNPDGFSFENYGGDSGNENLTASEMRRLFGDGVCAEINGGACRLTPEAQSWMDDKNKEMSGGHCYGFSVLSEELFKGQSPTFGSGKPYDYRLAGNHGLQHNIAYAFTYQYLDSVNNASFKGSPNQTLERIIKVLSEKTPETYTIGIFKQDDTGGHAVTPFEVIDHGGGRVGVEIYDNNYPGETREMLFDTKANTWTYNAAINPTVAPEVYLGTARHPGIELDPTTPGIPTQWCPFCGGNVPHRGTPTPRPLAAENQVHIEGNPRNHAHLLITDSRGRRVGYVGDKVLNEIPGARAEVALQDDVTEKVEPLYRLPDHPDNIVVDGALMRAPDTETLSSIGPNHEVVVRSLRIAPKQRDVLRLGSEMRELTFTTAPGQHGSPVLHLGQNTTTVDYSLNLELVDFHPGATVHVRLDTARKRITFFSTSDPGSAKYVLGAVDEPRHGTPRTLAQVTVGLRGAQSVTYSYAGRSLVRLGARRARRGRPHGRPGHRRPPRRDQDDAKRA